MRKIIAFALFGGHPTYGIRQYYWDCLPGCLRSYKNFFPDFELVIFHDDVVNDARSRLLRHYHYEGLVTLVPAGPNEAVCKSMLWRIKPLWQDDVDVLLCRDLDGGACRKERRAVDIWLETGLAAHAINDNPAHTAPYMGGMIGFRPALVRSHLTCPSWDQFVGLSDQLHQPTGGWDQILLHQVMWTFLGAHTCAHRFAGLRQEPAAGRCFFEVDGMWPHGVAPGLEDRTDSLVPFIGCSGIDTPRATDIYDAWGDPELARRFQHAEHISESTNITNETIQH